MGNYIRPVAAELPGVGGAAIHILADPIKGGWNVFDTTKPNEPQVHFDEKEEAIIYAQQLSAGLGVSYCVGSYEALSIGR